MKSLIQSFHLDSLTHTIVSLPPLVKVLLSQEHIMRVGQCLVFSDADAHTRYYKKKSYERKKTH